MVRFAVAVSLAMLSGCLDTDCRVGTYRCAGDELEICTGHPAGPVGPIDDPGWDHGSGPTWDKAADCGANRCIAGAKPFCALDAVPEPACAAITTSGEACDGTTQIRCNAGYAMERTMCRSCNATTGDCTGSLYATCSNDTDCASGMTCTNHTCEQPCSCPDGASCAVCDAVDEQSPDPHLGLIIPRTCHASTCI